MAARPGRRLNTTGMVMAFHVRTPYGNEIPPTTDDNLDVLIDLDDGRTYAATFFTITSLRVLMQTWRETGECAGGLYVWAADMIVVEAISRDVVETAVADLIAGGELGACCTLVSRGSAAEDQSD